MFFKSETNVAGKIQATKEPIQDGPTIKTLTWEEVIMAIGKIVHIVGILIAVVAALVAVPQAALLIAIVGLVGGYYVTVDDRIMYLVATVALVTVPASLTPIPTVGMYLTSILTNLGALFAAGAVTVILLTTYEKVLR